MDKKSFLKKTIWLGASASIVALSAQSANAAFFALREQSAYNQGASFAGASAQTNALSSFFFNPAIITEFEGIAFDGTLNVILPFTDASTTVNPAIAGFPDARTGTIGARTSSSNIGKEALVPASYASYQLNDNIWAGLAVNAPFGLGTRSDPTSAEALTSQEFSAASINFQPTIAYKFNERFSIAVGAQAQIIDVEQSANQLNGVNNELNATDWSFGVIFGATFKPTDKTTIGFGYRSQMNVDLEGDLTVRTPVGTEAARFGANADLALPDIVNVGVTHEFTDRFTGLFQFSWENWSRLQSVDVNVPALSTAIPAARFDFNLTDSFFYSVGAEYKITDHLTGRAGIAFETSPTNDVDRSLALPDNNRLWLSVGGTHKLSKHIESDFGFTWIRVERDTPVGNAFQAPDTVSGLALGGLAGVPISSGTANSQVFIFSAGSRIRF